ncbi:MAG: lipocalin family protein [Xanthomonadales bacterium]|jgi:apolipoprotein D and lipocalin family protein|nr:lipocalin family protein [Xanthomonadales bacterium]
MSLRKNLAGLSGALLLTGCQASLPPIEPVDYVNLPRFMGDWYVIANIPTWLEQGAHNAVESYRLDDDGTIATTFTFRADAFGGPEKRYTPRGFVRDTESNAVWGMQFVWPFKGDYRIIHLTDDYSVTVIGRNKRDYVWLMAREPELSPERYDEAVRVIAAAGYDVSLLQRVPQQWPQP